MSLEKMILIFSWVMIFLILILFVPKDKRRDAAIIFLAGQVITWGLSHIFVELKWIENPVVEFSKASRTNFTFNFALYPTFNVVYSLYFPQKKNVWIKIAYIVIIPALITPFFYFVEKYTDLIHFIKIKWYARYLIFVISSYVIQIYYEWFFKRFQKEYGNKK